MKTFRRTLLATGVAMSCLAALPAQAQAPSNYPTRAITVIVPYPPGGDTDAIARVFAEKLSESLKATVLVENKGGAGGTVGTSYVHRAKPDGYTILFTPNPFTTAQMVLKLPPSTSYDVLNGFEPIIQTATQPLILATNPNTGLKSVKDVIDRAKSGKNLNYGSPGAGSPMHIIAEWLNTDAGVKLTHVPYRGVGPSVTDAVAGHVDMVWATIGAIAPYVEAGRLVPLAIGDTGRSKLAPNVPTLVESGYPKVTVAAWNGFFAPKNTPKEVINLLNKHLNEALKNPEVVEKLGVFGAEPAGGAPDVLAKTNATDYEVQGKLIRELGITAE